MLKSFYSMIFLGFLSSSVPGFAQGIGPEPITLQDLSGNQGYYHHIAYLKRDEAARVTFSLGELIAQGAERNQSMKVSLAGLSDVAPDCSSVASALGLRGKTKCTTTIDNMSTPLQNEGGVTNLNCTTKSRDIYETRRICPESFVAEARIGRCPEPNFRADDAAARRSPQCPQRPVCRTERVKVRTETDSYCSETFNTLSFKVESFRSATAQSIDTFVTTGSVTSTMRLSINGFAAPFPTLNNYPEHSNTSKTISSVSWFGLVCENNGQLVSGRTFNNPNISAEYTYQELWNACGEGNINFISNRPLLFDTGTVVFSFQNPY